MQIKTKAQFYALWEAGRLGNKLRTWRDPAEAYSSGVPLVGFREVGKAGGGKFSMAKREDIVATAHDWRMDGRQFMICEAAPDHRGTVQGEVCEMPGLGLVGMLGLSKGLRMRDAIAQGLLVPRGLAATRLIVRRYMDEGSQAELDRLLADYPGAAVEFTCYEIPVGERDLNTIFWEVRHY
jgi:hypothetical protein